MTSTTHLVAPEEIMALIDGELSASEARVVSDHLKECAQCAMVGEQFRATSEMLSRWDVEAAPIALENSVAAKTAVHRIAVNSGGTGFRRRRLLVVGSGALVGMALLLAAVFSWSPRQSPPNDELVLADKPIEGYVQPQLSKKRQQQAEPFHTLASRPAGGIVPGVAGMGPPVSAGVAGTGFSGGRDGQLEASSTAAPMITRSASLTIRVKNVEAARSSLDSILARHHGYPAQLNGISPENGPRGFAASLRIPAADLVSAIGEIKELGRLENESQSGEDVTQQHADVAARLKTARETEERFRAILQQRTGKLSDVLEVEQNIARIRGEIEAMEAAQKSLEHRVDFASVEIQLTEDYKAQLSLPDSVSTRIHNAFVAGYHNATETLLGFLLFFEEYGPSLVIWLVVLVLPIVLVWRRYKKVRSAM